MSWMLVASFAINLTTVVIAVVYGVSRWINWLLDAPPPVPSPYAPPPEVPKAIARRRS